MKMHWDAAGLRAGVMVRGYGEDAGWIDGAYVGRSETETAAEARAGAHGVLLASSFELEENATLDGTSATVAAHPRYRGEFVRLAVPRACHAEVMVTLRNPSALPRACCAVANGLTRAACAVEGGATCVMGFAVELDRRHIDLSFAPVDGAAVAEGLTVPLPVSSLASGASLEVELVAVDVELVERASAERPTVFIAADSLAQTYPDAVRPQTGWGEWVAHFLYPDHAVAIERDAGGTHESATRYTGRGPVVCNRALGGRSARSFAAERRLEGILADIRPGDILLIQFGANDATCVRPARYTPPERFAAVLDCYLTAAEDRGARPVLITPPPRYHFDAAGRELIDFSAYADVERDLARTRGVALVDLSREGAQLLERLGPELASALYLKVSAGQYDGFPDGADDSTHLSPVGARAFAQIIVSGMARQLEGISCFAARPEGPVAPCRLQARAVDAAAACVRLTWQADECNDFYTVERADGGEGPSWRALARDPFYIDDAVAGLQDISYTVTAWRDGRASDPVSVRVAHAFAVSSARQLQIPGFSLYEIDEGIADRTSFSVRFSALPGIDTYRVVAENPASGRSLVLGRIEGAAVDGLHSYAVNNEPGWRVFVEGANADGALVRSRAEELPVHDADAPGARASWEAPF
ncbi:hypothetical protein H6A18_10005 [Collinsella tanakaei]|uniref:GDSL-type esterase/lipase family protein n=1 Tax=Collinsella tanakaei TaxID=626935 RepID=UPI00195C011F|nr:GDSL-type esterase/lipase family protein [Collinsella tanakaei]MBM6756835.1 hypothetical protein [Collinsella tanakaei]